MKSKSLLRVAALALALSSVAASVPSAHAAPSTAPSRPNVLLILCDDLRWDALGCAGHPHLQTPNIDRLAAEGVRFKNAFCTTSLCSPSRASILTGVYAHTHKVRDNFTELPTDLPNFPRALQAAGYDTGYIGKWHMGENNDERRPGFDYWVSHQGQGKYFGTEFNVNGRRELRPGYYTHEVTGFALDFLKQPRPADKPWLLVLGHKAPHSFYVPEPKYSNAFDHVRIEYPDTAFKLDGKPAWIKDRLYTWHGIYGPLFEWRKQFPDDRPEAVKDFAAMTRAYWSVIRSVDDSVGQLRSALEASGQLDRTLVLFMGDNGLLNGEHGMVDKRTMHEPSLRIPLLARYSGLTPTAAPRVIDQMVLTEDIAPSVLDLCGIAPIKKTDGRSFKKLVQRGDRSWRRSFLYEYNYEKQFPYTPNVRGVRTDDWKFMRYPPGDGSADRHLAELYDLKNDPEERHNLIADPRQAGKVKELQKELARLLKATGALPDAMPLDEGIKKELPDQKIR
ncbi:MAG: sulfatase [Verrucomicrobia bacterium]|nr:sulfatase [Verrucomicrobiota bacterium]